MRSMVNLCGDILSANQTIQSCQIPTAIAIKSSGKKRINEMEEDIGCEKYYQITSKSERAIIVMHVQHVTFIYFARSLYKQ